MGRWSDDENNNSDKIIEQLLERINKLELEVQTLRQDVNANKYIHTPYLQQHTCPQYPKHGEIICGDNGLNNIMNEVEK